MTRIRSFINFTQSLRSARNLAATHGIENHVDLNQFMIRPLGKILYTSNLQYCIALMVCDEKHFAFAHIELVENQKDGEQNIEKMLANFPHIAEGRLFAYQVLNSSTDGEIYGDDSLYGRSYTNRTRVPIKLPIPSLEI